MLPMLSQSVSQTILDLFLTELLFAKLVFPHPWTALFTDRPTKEYIDKPWASRQKKFGRHSATAPKLAVTVPYF